MVITGAVSVQARDLAQFAWAGLRRFHDVTYVERSIIELHQLSLDQFSNARKQVRQIRYCLMQAREYAEAAEAVTFVTKPLLYYYCVISLAVAELLLKQTGESSLDRARAQHGNHGLTFSAGSVPHAERRLAMVASQLRAKPVVRSGDRFGTFELWHRSAREMPEVGVITHYHQNGGTTTTHDIILGAVDKRLPLLPAQGISLIEALVKLPTMFDLLLANGIQPQIIRGKITRDIRNNVLASTTVILHPTQSGLIDRFQETCIFHPADHSAITYHPIAEGGALTWHGQLTPPEREGYFFPPGSMWSEEEIRFWPEVQPLNEFGYFYAALYIAGNYARYYPDRWISDVEESSPIAQAIEALLAEAEIRVPLLALSELSRRYHMPAS